MFDDDDDPTTFGGADRRMSRVNIPSISLASKRKEKTTPSESVGDLPDGDSDLDEGQSSSSHEEEEEELDRFSTVGDLPNAKPDRRTSTNVTVPVLLSRAGTATTRGVFYASNKVHHLHKRAKANLVAVKRTAQRHLDKISSYEKYEDTQGLLTNLSVVASLLLSLQVSVFTNLSMDEWILNEYRGLLMDSKEFREVVYEELASSNFDFITRIGSRVFNISDVLLNSPQVKEGVFFRSGTSYTHQNDLLDSAFHLTKLHFPMQKIVPYKLLFSVTLDARIMGSVSSGAATVLFATVVGGALFLYTALAMGDAREEAAFTTTTATAGHAVGGVDRDHGDHGEAREADADAAAFHAMLDHKARGTGEHIDTRRRGEGGEAVPTTSADYDGGGEKGGEATRAGDDAAKKSAMLNGRGHGARESNGGGGVERQHAFSSPVVKQQDALREFNKVAIPIICLLHVFLVVGVMFFFYGLTVQMQLRNPIWKVSVDWTVIWELGLLFPMMSSITFVSYVAWYRSTKASRERRDAALKVRMAWRKTHRPSINTVKSLMKRIGGGGRNNEALAPLEEDAVASARGTGRRSNGKNSGREREGSLASSRVRPSN